MQLIGLVGNRRSIENQGDNRTNTRRQLVDEPRYQEGHQVGRRTNDAGKDQGVLAGDNKDIVCKEQVDSYRRACGAGRHKQNRPEDKGYIKPRPL